jgi:3-phenylpropionate/cinnamic acid dioxygenase small subunit
VDAISIESPNGLYLDLLRFLNHEAELLDRGDVRAWLDLLTPDVTYRVPVRITRERAAGNGFSTTSWHLNETFGSLEARVARLETEYAWAEDPPSRTRRFVTNVRVDQADGEDLVRVASNLLLFRSRDASPEYQLISGERRDLLRRSDDSWRIAQRYVYLDHSTLSTQNLALFM